MDRRLILVLATVLAALPASLAAQGPSGPPSDSCVTCHTSLSDNLQVTAETYATDVHAVKGLSCAACHGGDPKSDDPQVAMSRARGFRGKPARREIPALCARCHSDAAFMRQFNPSLRTDQLAQYQTSVHGRRLAGGDAKVAVCTDCHSVHNIRPASNPLSTVHPVNIATTCARCHGNADYMKPYGVPTNQVAEYNASVHHEALAVRGDLSAPTCTTCHGNHGAAPPGVSSIEFVCSTCHVFQAQLFDRSPHQKPFAAMKLGACIGCHSNHRIQHPTDAMLGTGSGSICLNCHTQGDKGYEAAQLMATNLAKLDTAIGRSGEILERAERSGMEVSQPKLELMDARENLIKARVNIHAFDPKRLDDSVTKGIGITQKTYQAGVLALRERDFRRKGLAVALIIIAVVLSGLYLAIRNIEKPKTD